MCIRDRPECSNFVLYFLSVCCNHRIAARADDVTLLIKRRRQSAGLTMVKFSSVTSETPSCALVKITNPDAAAGFHCSIIHHVQLALIYSDDLRLSICEFDVY